MNRKIHIGDRVRMVRKDLKMNQADFGNQLGGLKKSSISKIEHNQNAISKRNIEALCSVFSVNREWLTTGNGDMYDPPTRKEEIENEFIKILSNNPKLRDKQKRFFHYLSELTDDQWDILATISYSMLCANKVDNDQ